MTPLIIKNLSQEIRTWLRNETRSPFTCTEIMAANREVLGTHVKNNAAGLVCQIETSFADTLVPTGSWGIAFRDDADAMAFAALFGFESMEGDQ